MNSTKLLGLRMISLCTILVILAGCASPQGDFQTKRDPSYQNKLDRTLIVSVNDDLAARLGRDFYDRLYARLTQTLATKGVLTQVVHQNKEAVDPAQPIRSAFDTFHPNQVIAVAVTSVNSRNEVRPANWESLPQFSSEVSIAFSFVVSDAKSGKVVWRGTDQFHLLPAPEDVADQLIGQLQTESFLAK